MTKIGDRGENWKGERMTPSPAHDSDHRTGMHISEMSHSHSFGEVKVCQVSPTAERTKYRC